MAKNGPVSQSTRRDKPKFEDFKFVNIKVYQADKARFDEWRKSEGEDTDLLLARMAVDGYKMSISWDDGNSSFICSHTCLNPRDENYCLVLSSRSDDFFEAIALNVFKHFVLCVDCLWHQSDNLVWG